ncbi:peptidoglycan DD-metalloendopeptidase family protein [Mesobacillus maritimus]|uniref:murein hydrolase activator EnvC family protein n=1 Tax=Mesobacillus maritimus TaxID=1643336 RepID=UPI002040EDCE|nr:peptidoglycan DD-metalloendopeptidase family protein [Mesobacillus maritimus]
MKKQVLSLALVSTLSIGMLFNPAMVNQASAEGISELKQKEENIKKKQSSLQSDIQQGESKISELKNEQANVDSEIKRLDLAVADATNKIAEKNEQIDETEKEVEQLEKEIEILIERIEKRNELLKERAASYQESGGSISYIDVLFGAQSFSDFVDRVGAVATLVQADQDILEQHQQDKKDLETKQAEVKAKLADLQDMKKELEVLKAELDSQMAEKKKLMESLQKEEEHMHAEILAKEEENAVLASQAAAIQKAIQLEQQRQAELEKQREAEAAAAAAAASAKATSSNDGGSSSSSSSSNSVQAASTPPPVSGGSFTWPASGYVSSGYGSRSLGNHHGIDIAKGGNVPIVAAADGVVIRSYYSSSYGNAIFISHSINGQVYTTVYAHMSNRAVGSGAVVKKGQRIGTMGNTGQSFGQHLHFELHKGAWNMSKSNAVNPLSYLP